MPLLLCASVDRKITVLVLTVPARAPRGVDPPAHSPVFQRCGDSDTLVNTQSSLLDEKFDAPSSLQFKPPNARVQLHLKMKHTVHRYPGVKIVVLEHLPNLI